MSAAKQGKKASAPIILDDPNQGFSYSQSKDLREHLKLRLDSTAWQWTIIALVICDALLVGTDIVLSSVYCDHPPHSVERTEHYLRILSIIILSFFVLEWLVEAWVHGIRRWMRTVIHAFDFAIVLISLGLEYLALFRSRAGIELGGLLVVFRLWRVVRVMQAVREVQHKRAHEQITSLKEANSQLFEIHQAHHEVVKGLHHEFVQRLNAVRSARFEHLCEDATAEKPVLLRSQPSLDGMLSAVSRHSQRLGQSVNLHRQSIHMAKTMNDGKPMQPGQSLYSEAQGDTSSVFKDPQFVDMKPQTLQRVQETGLDTENLADVSEGVRASSDGGSKL